MKAYRTMTYAGPMPMTREQAVRVASLLRTGRRYRSGHTMNIQTHLMFREGQFVELVKDARTGVPDPVIRSLRLAEEEFLIRLMETYDYEAVLSSLSI